MSESPETPTSAVGAASPADGGEGEGEAAGGRSLRMRIGIGIGRVLLGFAPAFILTVALMVARAMKCRDDVGIMLTLGSFVVGLIYICFWSGTIVTDRSNGAIRGVKMFLLVVLMAACNFVLSVAGCMVIYLP